MADENENKPWSENNDRQQEMAIREAQSNALNIPKTRLPETTNANENNEEEEEEDEDEEEEEEEEETENETSQDENGQAAQLGKQMAKKAVKQAAKKAAQVAAQAAKMAARVAVSTALSIAASVASAIASFLAATIPIWLPAIIIIFCATITYQYWLKHSWDPTLYWDAANGNYAELIDNAINDTDAYDPPPTPKAKDTIAPKASGGAPAK